MMEDNVHNKYLESFRTFLSKRQTLISSGVHIDNTKWIYDSFLKPLFDRGVYKKSMSKSDQEKFIGELFALSVYNKNHGVQNWVYEPEIEGLTPDFSINSGSKYIEVYSPAMNHGSDNWDYYTQTNSQGEFARKNLTKEINKKSRKYVNHIIIFVVHIIVGEFVSDLLESMKNVSLASNSHEIYLYHGDKEYFLKEKK